MAVQDIAPPLVIGGTGGSGTRVVARIVRRAGWFIGTNLNPSEDSMEFPEMYDMWINRYLLRDIVPLSAEEETLLLRGFCQAIERHRSPMTDHTIPWGWKEPRSIYFLPFLDSHWTGVRFIHVVRDGRDMAFSTNQHQCRKHGPAVLRQELRDAPQPVRSAKLWALVNSQAAQYGETQMPGRYLRVRYEDLCGKREPAIGAILQFLDSRAPLDESMLQEVASPGSIGRWRNSGDPLIVGQINEVASEALHRFDYC